MTLGKLDLRSATRNEFLMMPFSAFNGKLKSGLHYKNKFYAVLFFDNADGSIIIDDREFELKSHTFFFINYNQVYYFKDHESIEGEVILFTKSFYNHVYTGNKMIKSDTALHNVSPFISLKSENLSEIKQTLEELRSEYQSHRQARKEILCLLLKVFVLKYIRNSSKKDLINRSVDHKKKVVDDFNDLVNLHYKELKTTSKYAEKLNINASYLNTLVKEILDITAGQVIKNRIILEAERLLLHSSLSIIEISYELGFNDNSHFGKYFKSVRGVSPNNFRTVQLK
ncbi:helix-turn-helix domain-containing protein [Chryseobacterium gregarium]|uniref:helix-turn-helix domain-containing protein n=1 Tax=Chryseobacterium gregarium TaxID=456299 RepID=UPI0012DBEBBA|nr:helix-turn-helix domain-containing protein [Chryseobacterium gregarium]